MPREGAEPHEKLGAWAVNFASNATSFCPEKQGRKLRIYGRKFPYIRKFIFAYTKKYFRICGNFSPCGSKKIAVRREGKSPCGSRFFSLRKAGNFLTYGNFPACARKFIALRTAMNFCSFGGKFGWGRRGFFLRTGRNFRSKGKGFFFGGREIFLRTKRSFLPKRLGLVFGRKLFFLREEGVPFAEGKEAVRAGLADDELADEGRRGEDRTKKVDASGDVDPCFLDAPCREELSPLHVQQI